MCTISARRPPSLSAATKYRATIAVLGAALTVAAPAHSADLSYRKRGDRHEGIVDTVNVSGFSLYLTSFALAADLGGGARMLRVDVPSLPAALQKFDAPLQIEVVHLERSYRMRPNQTLRPGQGFTWPLDEVVRPARIEPTALDVKAVGIDGGGEEIYYPAVLVANDRIRGDGPAYRFRFQSRADADLAWTIRAVDSGAEVGHGDDVPRRGGALELNWTPTRNGERIPAGLYELEVRGHLLDPRQPVRIGVRFLHH